MSRKTAQNADPETDVAIAPNAPHPLDSWLKRELQALYGESARDALPPGIAELAARLEEKLRGAGRAPVNPVNDDEAPGEGPGPDPTRGPERTIKGRKQ
jgi:hypothetical protein